VKKFALVPFILLGFGIAETAEATISQRQYEQILDRLFQVYEPIVSQLGAKLEFNRQWESDVVNGSAQKIDNRWIVNSHGGFARNPEITEEGFALQICHELGHLVGGFPMQGVSEMAVEGQADYYGAFVCLPKLWKDQHERNAAFRTSVDPVAKNRCDSVWQTLEEQNLCYRIAMAGMSWAKLSAALGNDSHPGSHAEPDFGLVDSSIATETAVGHGKAQCRLDTYMQAALCKATYDDRMIPGLTAEESVFGPDAEMEALQTSCMSSGGYKVGTRPRCWFKPNLELPIAPSLQGETNVQSGEDRELVYWLTNQAIIAMDGIDAEIIPLSPFISIEANGFEAPLLGPDESIAKSFSLSVDASAPCGERLDYLFKIIQTGRTQVFERSLRVGELTYQSLLSRKGLVGIITNREEAAIPMVLESAPQDASRLFLFLDITHFDPKQLELKLVAPTGAVIPLLPKADGHDVKQRFEVALPSGTSLEGEWKLLGKSRSTLTGIVNMVTLEAATAHCE
jgi:hypothetical protein